MYDIFIHMTKTELSQLAEQQIEIGKALLVEDGLDPQIIELLVTDTEEAVFNLLGCGNTALVEQFIERVVPYFNAQRSHPVAIQTWTTTHK